jgi:UDP-glucuronate 4-epimerase
LRILVTGSAGFIGSSLASFLGAKGFDVFGLDSLSNYYDVALKERRLEEFPVLRNYIGEIQDTKFLTKVLDEVQPESVIHLAAQPGVRLPISKNFRYVEDNLIGFTSLLTQIVDRQIPNFLYASSSSVYGDSSTPPYSEKELNIAPNSFYGVTKYSNELMTPTLIKGSETRARGMRFFTVYGPWGRPDMAYFRMVSNVLTGSPFELFGKGDIKRDFTYIDDVVKAIYELHSELLHHPFEFHDVVNIGGGRPVSMLEVLETISEIVGKRVEFSNGEANYNDVSLTVSDPSYLYELTNFKPTIEISTGLEKFVTWGNDPKIRPALPRWISSVL